MIDTVSRSGTRIFHYFDSQSEQELQRWTEALKSAAICDDVPSQPVLPTRAPCTTRLRIIAINDVYEIENFSRLKTLIQTESAGLPAQNVITTLAGDFIGPSVLSSLDSGRGMVRLLNMMPVKYVCFGNHETDVPYDKLVERIGEFRGTWLNSNMPDFKPELPCHSLLELVGDDGEPCARTVGFLGFCIGGGKFGATYRDGAFGGAARSIIPIPDCFRERYEDVRTCCPHVDAVIPITHQDMPEDVELANSGLFPVIVAGHDHEIVDEIHGPRECHVVKGGQDAQHAMIIDIVWPAEADGKPSVSVSQRSVKDYESNADVEAEIYKINAPVRELEEAVLYEMKPGESLSSKGIKFGESSMARQVATAIASALDCDAAVVNSGAVRGKTEYNTVVTYSDLQKECPYPSMMVVTQMPFHVLRDAIRESRRPWWDISSGEERKEANSAFHVDFGMELDAEHFATQIANGPPDPDGERLYAVACDCRYLKKNPVLSDYCKAFPGRIQPEDCGRPVLPILVEYFCTLLWQRFSNAMLTKHEHEDIFAIVDTDHDGFICLEELQSAVAQLLGKQCASRVIVSQMLSMKDDNHDSRLEPEELRAIFSKAKKSWCENAR
eukprot:TRINITY_DN65176_c0_g1_i1.p1 TRINITY_DN65176_c0_g1~~TRINITY_DN65176_c0_g1_i1.p1  ORF type:complete len:703 (-),score=62.21 TRINITY_DN65176_c0_g1_i1:196-2028(-)